MLHDLLHPVRVLLGAVVELGRLPARLAEFIAAVEAPVVFTPDREILLCDLGEGVAETVVRVLAPMGLIFDAAAPLLRVSACVGDHGCARAQGDSLAHAADLARAVLDGGAPGIHLYAFNNHETVLAVLRAAGLIEQETLA